MPGRPLDSAAAPRAHGARLRCAEPYPYQRSTAENPALRHRRRLVGGHPHQTKQIIDDSNAPPRSRGTCKPPSSGHGPKAYEAHAPVGARASPMARVSRPRAPCLECCVVRYAASQRPHPGLAHLACSPALRRPPSRPLSTRKAGLVVTPCAPPFFAAGIGTQGCARVAPPKLHCRASRPRGLGVSSFARASRISVNVWCIAPRDDGRLPNPAAS